MPSYSAELKEQAVRKLMPPNNRTIARLSQEIGVSAAALYNRKKQFQAQGYVVPKKPTIADHWDAFATEADLLDPTEKEVRKQRYRLTAKRFALQGKEQ